MFRFFDLHCDTISKLYETGESLKENNCHISMAKMENFSPSVLSMAVWLRDKYLNNPLKNTMDIINFAHTEINNTEGIKIIENIQQKDENSHSVFITVEGGEAIENNIDNILTLYNCGVRMITLTWNRENNLGYGAYTKTDKGLKDFGKECVKYMNNLNMIIDVSHLNYRGFFDVCELSTKPFTASHSNTYKICNNDRNLKDEQIKALKQLNCLVGLNFYSDFISEKGDIQDLIKHIYHFLNLGCEDNLALGSDFDGIDKSPFDNISNLHKLYIEIEKNFGQTIADKIFYNNAINFYKKIDKPLQK